MIPSVIARDTWKIPSDLAEVRPNSDRLLAFFGGLGLNDSDVFDIRLCFEESIINAMKYGNRLKKDVPVSVEAAYSDREIFIAVEDCGDGFDPKGVKDPTAGENLGSFSGRGVYLVRHLMDWVDFNAKGNRVEMVKVYRTIR